MTTQFRQTLIGLIWPGPIAGPIPVNVFRIASPVLVYSLGPFFASLIMATITCVLVIFYFEILELTGGKKFVEDKLELLPKPIHQIILARALFPLLIASVLVGVFPLALGFRLLKYPRTFAEIVLVFGSFVNSFLWTGLVWGLLVGLAKTLLS
jgi:hypothetical protein